MGKPFVQKPKKKEITARLNALLEDTITSQGENVKKEDIIMNDASLKMYDSATNSSSLESPYVSPNSSF